MSCVTEVKERSLRGCVRALLCERLCVCVRVRARVCVYVRESANIRENFCVSVRASVFGCKCKSEND